jgi:hypothetical protein
MMKMGKMVVGLIVLHVEKCDKIGGEEGEDDRMGTWVSHLIKR